MICRHGSPPLFLLDDAAAQDAFACAGVIKHQGLAGRDGALGVVKFDPQAVAVGIDRAGRFPGGITYLAQGPEGSVRRLLDPGRFTGMDNLREQVLFRADDDFIPGYVQDRHVIGTAGTAEVQAPALADGIGGR